MNIPASVLHKPYPLEERKPAQLKLAFVFSVVVFLFLFLFNPFGNKSDVLLNAAYAGVLTFTAIMIDFLLLFPLFPHYFKEEKWNIGREIVLTLIIIITIASLNMLAGSLLWSVKLSAINWLRMIFYTALIGIAPATASILLNQTRLLKKYRRETNSINEQLQPVSTAEPTPEIVLPSEKIKDEQPIAVQLIIESENPKDNISMQPSHFLAAASADNYVKIYHIENVVIKTSILRTTLKKVEENAAAFPTFFRCHRTALVNMAAVENLSGTAQGYRLHLTGLADSFPVSRNLNKVIKNKLAAIRP